MKNSLGDYLLDRTESLDEKLILDYFIERNDDKINRLLDSEQYLLEGSRGVGKTMLMKTAMLRSIEDFGKNSVLPVWISFEESIRLERIVILDNSIDPFLQWTMGKILDETLKMLLKIKPGCINKLNSRLSDIFGLTISDNSTKYSELLNEYIKTLEKADIKDSDELKKCVPSTELANILDNPQSFKDFLLKLVNDFSLSRIVFLFDEAAHVFSHTQQEKFFTFFKSLRDPKIACKAAVYPGITNYGKYFERGQDAKEIRINWKPLNSNDVDFIRQILKKRIQEFNPKYWEKLNVNKDIIDTICICSNGNPRFAFHIIDELENSKAFQSKISNQILINSIRTVFNTKWKEFDTLKQRLIKYSQHISEAEVLMKETLIPNLRLWNDKQRTNKRKLSIGFYISTKAYDSLEKLFSVLDYSNITSTDHSKKSLGHNKYGYYITINPSLIFTDLILKGINELNSTSVAIENNQAYTESSTVIKELLSSVNAFDEYNCLNTSCDFKTVEDTFKFCPKCGTKIQKEEIISLYKILRSHNIDNIKLSKKITDRLSVKFHNIGELYDAEKDDIRMKYIQNVRIELVKNAVIEYMAG
jgi:hypothetical protein